MAEKTESNKANMADLSKIPENEFEKHFHEWMERDDVARGLQAKLRCDLIKNFNKTSLGKQIQAHTMCSTGGSTYRLTMTPLVLALNTLVAEFLYAQNCHFTLSVFCTEVPFRNTLPDFDGMRHYRFSEREIHDIWEAIAGAAVAHKHPLDTQILEDYDKDTSNSLLLLILKSLVNIKPQEMLRKSVEIQTETNATHQEKCSTPVQAGTQRSSARSKSKSSDCMIHLDKFLLILSQKVNEMTQAFESLTQERNLQKPRSKKTLRSREFHSLNRSLDQINVNVKHLVKSKRKSKRMTHIVESIDSLTQQFCKYAVKRELTKKEKNEQNGKLETSLPKGNSKEIQTENEMQEKTYSDWVYEMRNTENGRKFLERIESSLYKAVAKHRDQLQSEHEAKLKHMKNLLKLRYKQKMLIQLSSQGSEEQANEARKLSENIEMKLKNFESKQLELLDKLRQSSLELHEAQRQLHARVEVHKGEEQCAQRRDQTTQPMDKSKKLQKQLSQMIPDEENEGVEVATQYSAMENSPEVSVPMPIRPDLKSSVITPRDQNVERIINETKLRLQQLETESSCLEKDFQNYLERRNRENKCRQEATYQLIEQSQNKTSQMLQTIDQTKRSQVTFSEKSPSRGTKMKFPLFTEEDLDLDEEFQRLKGKLALTQSLMETTTMNGGSSSSTSKDLKNAIRDAKEKFFENELIFRQHKERELMRKSSGFGEHNSSFPYNCDMASSEAVPQSRADQRIDSTFALDLNRNKEKGLVTTSNEMPEQPKDSKKSPRRELFPKQSKEEEFKVPMAKNTNLRQTIDDLKSYTQNKESKEDKSSESSEELIKQSMAKMKQLFGKDPCTSKQAETYNQIHKNETKDKVNYVPLRDILNEKPSELNQTTSSSITTTTSAATTTTSASTMDAVAKRQLDMLESISIPPTTYLSSRMTQEVEQIQNDHISKPSTLNLTMTSDSEESSSSDVKENQNSDQDISEISSAAEVAEPLANVVPELLITTRGDSLEIGEVLSETQTVFAPLSKVSSSEGSSSNASDFDLSLERSSGKQNKAKTSDESEGEFWA
ncbi:kinesin-like protein KIF15-A [Stomoxys calcitrans]|uniref:kinesin-like protein KIF15-A n=1 Tax=Stomoxys calcitrans TaxID=35570 RepID=UPI0027E22470|nr:kinesin-like protein KIF15-A [Stomoxys calcitrans]